MRWQNNDGGVRIDVCFTPQDYITHPPGRDHAVVVLDIFRASTSITTAFTNGCRRIVPVASIEDALALRGQYPGALLAGERQAKPIPGFDLSNSPFEFSRQAVADKTIIMTTTNGTVALQAAAKASRVYVGAFVNAAAVTRALAATGLDVVILCAGTQGRFTLEDALCAGLIAGRLEGEKSDAAHAASAIYSEYRCDLLRRANECANACYLASIGYGDDVGLCLQHDIYDVAPVFENGVITDPAAK